MKHSLTTCANGRLMTLRGLLSMMGHEASKEYSGCAFGPGPECGHAQNAAPLRIFIEPGGYRWGNLGDTMSAPKLLSVRLRLILAGCLRSRFTA